MGKNRTVANRIEDTEISPHSYSHLIFHRSAKTYFGGRAVSSTNGDRRTGYPHVDPNIDHSQPVQKPI
jgi:hypothetical protein